VAGAPAADNSERIRLMMTADDPGPELHEGLRDLGAHLVGHVGHGDSRMPRQAFLDLARTRARTRFEVLPLETGARA
jgi:hypothetical protein